MKKVLAIILAIAMIAVFVPAFTAGAAAPSYEEAIAGKQKLEAYTNYSDDPEGYASIEKGAQINGCGCGFIDGNVYFKKANAKTLLSGINNEEVLVFINGTPAYLSSATLHAGYRGVGVGGGFQLAIVGGSFAADTAATVTMVFGNTGLYTEFDFVPNAASLTYDSADVEILGSKATVTVESAEIAAAYAVGDTFNARVHDDHADRVFTVESIKGNTVVFVSENFAKTNYFILEMNYGTAKAFSVDIDTNLPGGTVPAPKDGETFYAAYQTKPGAKAGNDWRFIFSAKAADLAAGYKENNSIAETAVVTLTFNKGDAVVKSFSKNFSELSYMYQVQADGEYWTPTAGCALFGFIIRDVPTFAWTSYTLKITKGDDVLFESSDLKPIEETVALGGYTWLQGEQNIHAGSPENPTQGDRPGNNEGAWRFFDKTEVKAGLGGGEGNNGTLVVTWNYDAAKTVSLYALYTGNDSTGGTNRNPLAWTLYGSADGATFTEIDVVTNPVFPGEGGWVTYFEVASPAAYQYYKIEFTTNAGAYFQLAEIKMFESAANVAFNFNDSIAGAKDYAVQNLGCWGDGVVENFFDGNAGTKLGGGTNGNPVSVTWKYDSAVTATGYGITTANDSTRYNRNPKSWVLYGSTDGVTWEVLDEVSTSTLFSNELMIFGIDDDASAAYQYYRIDFVPNGGAFQMADIVLYN